MDERSRFEKFKESARSLLFLPFPMWSDERGRTENFLVTLLSMSLYTVVYGLAVCVAISPFISTWMWWIVGSCAIMVLILARGKLRTGNDIFFWRTVVVICALYIVAKPIGVYVISYRTVDAVIRDSERITQIDHDGTDNSHYRLTTNVDSYKIIDSWWFFQFKSSNLHGYAKSNIGKNCRIKVYGMRFAPMSLFPTVTNIICNN